MALSALQLDYPRIKRYWSRIGAELRGNYSVNYLMNMDDEAIAVHRFYGELQFVLGHLPSRRKRFLDLGCGTGNLTRELAKVFTSGEAVDFSRYAVSVARLKLKLYTKVTIACADVRRFPIKGTYNLIHIAELLMYLQDTDVVRLLSQVRKHIAPDGKIILRESISLGRTTNLNRGGHQTIRRSLEYWHMIFRRAGYRVQSQKQNPEYNFSWMVVLLAGWFPRKFGRDRILVFLLENKISRHFLLLILKALMITRRVYCQYYFVLQATQ